MPLVLAGLLPLVSLGGALTMGDGGAAPPPFGTEQRREALTGPTDGAGSERGVPGEEPSREEEPAYSVPGAAADAPQYDEEDDDSRSPGKSEDSAGGPKPRGRAEGRGQEDADENGRGPDR